MSRYQSPNSETDPARRDLVAAHHAGNDGVDTLKKAMGEVEYAFFLSHSVYLLQRNFNSPE